MVGGGPDGPAIGALACGLGAAREADALATGCPVPLVLQAARTTAHSAPVSASAHRRLPPDRESHGATLLRGCRGRLVAVLGLVGLP